MVKVQPSLSASAKSSRYIKTLLIVDATASMGNLVTNIKETIMKYFDECCKSLKESNYDQNLFKLQIAFYRNYSDGENILKVSPWVGPLDKLAL